MKHNHWKDKGTNDDQNDTSDGSRESHDWQTNSIDNLFSSSIKDLRQVCRIWKEGQVNGSYNLKAFVDINLIISTLFHDWPSKP